MTTNISSDGLQESRSIFGDITNHIDKRGFQSEGCNSSVKTGNGCGCSADKTSHGSQFAKKVCVEMESSKQEESRIRSMARLLLPNTCSEISSLKGTIIHGISKISRQTKDTETIDKGKSITENVDSSDANRDICVSTISVPTSLCSRDCIDVEGDNQKDEGIALEEKSFLGKLETSVSMIDDSEGHMDCSRLLGTQESQSSGLEHSEGLKAGGCSNSRETGVNLIKACFCSFCMKAAYIWSDLHYQDVKGRIAALKKSQREASILVQKRSGIKGICRHGQGISEKYAKLDSDLTDQWKSLFLHMEDIFVRESIQLEARLVELIDVRDSCKIELESAKGMPVQKP